MQRPPSPGSAGLNRQTRLQINRSARHKHQHNNTSRHTTHRTEAVEKRGDTTESGARLLNKKMAMAVPPGLKPVTQYVRRAEELDKAPEPESAVVAYHCRLYATEQAMKLNDNTEAG